MIVDQCQGREWRKFTSRYAAPAKLTTRRCLPKWPAERQLQRARDRSWGRVFISAPSNSEPMGATCQWAGWQACAWFHRGPHGIASQPSCCAESQSSASHDDKAINLNEGVTPFQTVGHVNLKQGDIRRMRSL